MSSFGLRVGLCGFLAVLAGHANAQTAQLPTAPPVQGGQPIPPADVRPGIVGGVPVLPETPEQLRGHVPGPFGFPSRPQDGIITGYIQPVFHWNGTFSDHVNSINAVVNRAMMLGDVGPNTQRLADTLEKGFPKILGTDSLGFIGKKKVADQGIRLAGNDPKDQAQAQAQPPVNPAPGIPDQDNGFKQTIEEINKIFRTQADLIRSIDVGSVRRNGYLGGGPVQDGSTVVLTGRTGLELSLISPEILDQLKVPRDQGLYIKEVYAKTPAELAGYKKGDVLLELNGRKVPSNFNDFLDKVMRTVKNDTPISGVVLRNGERIEVGAMKVTDKRVVPALPNERLPDLSSIIQVVPGLNSEQPNTNRVPELRIIRNGLTTEIIRVDPNKK